jgi:hypothetical protein
VVRPLRSTFLALSHTPTGVLTSAIIGRRTQNQAACLLQDNIAFHPITDVRLLAVHLHVAAADRLVQDLTPVRTSDATNIVDVSEVGRAMKRLPETAGATGNWMARGEHSC